MSDAQQQERRIAACLNACQSVSTEDLERHYETGAGIDEALEEAGLQDHLKAVHQRDQLLAALKAITDPNQVASHGDPSVLRNYARAAIAAAELSGNSGQLTAAEAAQPVVHGPYDVAFIGAGVWAGIPDELPPELVGKKVWLLTQPPASAQPVAVPEGDRTLAHDMALLELIGKIAPELDGSIADVQVASRKLDTMQVVPDGYALVPKEPTREQLDAAKADLSRAGEIDPMLKSIYRAMLSAAQIGGAA